MNNPLDNISAAAIERYSSRFLSLGEDVRTLGWGSMEQQRNRFSQLTRVVDLHGRSVLDIGCGFGDLKGFCDEMELALLRYIGWDINGDLIKVAKARYSNAELKVFDLLNTSGVAAIAQIGVMLGLLNFNLRDTYDNVEYSKRMISNAFEAVTECLVVDFLSIYRTLDYPSEDFVFYHDPSEMLAFALTLTPNVSLHHDYMPIPQKEFLLVLRK